MSLKFIADDMVGKLARWLRMVGYDTLYKRDITDVELLNTSAREERIILTRHLKLAQSHAEANIFVVDSESPPIQFALVVQRFGLDISSAAFSRCLDCNSLLQPVEKRDYAEAIPSHVYKVQEEFYRCAGCNKLYWPGSHYDAMTRKLRKAMDAL